MCLTIWRRTAYIEWRVHCHPISILHLTNNDACMLPRFVFRSTGRRTAIGRRAEQHHAAHTRPLSGFLLSAGGRVSGSRAACRRLLPASDKPTTTTAAARRRRRRRWSAASPQAWTLPGICGDELSCVKNWQHFPETSWITFVYWSTLSLGLLWFNQARFSLTTHIAVPLLHRRLLRYNYYQYTIRDRAKLKVRMTEIAYSHRWTGMVTKFI